jgi:ABC-type multidrug transport system fused ATPase/permease subunit
MLCFFDIPCLFSYWLAWLSFILAKHVQAISCLFVGLALGFSASWKIAFIVLAICPLTIFCGMIRSRAQAGMQ